MTPERLDVGSPTASGCVDHRETEGDSEIADLQKAATNSSLCVLSPISFFLITQSAWAAILCHDTHRMHTDDCVVPALRLQISRAQKPQLPSIVVANHPPNLSMTYR